MANVVVIKNLRGLNQVKHVKEHLKYIGFRSQELNKEIHKGFFSKDSNNTNMNEFIKRIEDNTALQHPKSIKIRKLVFSLKEWNYDLYKDTGSDYKELIRSTLKTYEDKYNVKLDWIANIHETEDHPHVHVAIKGVSDNKLERGYRRIKFKKDDIQILKDNFDNFYFSKVNRSLYYAKEMDQTIGKHFNDYNNNRFIKDFKEDYEKLLDNNNDLFNDFKNLCDNIPQFYNPLYDDKTIDQLSKNIIDKIVSSEKYSGISDSEKEKLRYFLLTRANIDRNNYVYIVNDIYMKQAINIIKDTSSYNINLSAEYEKLTVKLYMIAANLNIDNKVEYIRKFFNERGIHIGQNDIENILNNVGYERIQKERGYFLNKSLGNRTRSYEAIIKGFDIKDDELKNILQTIENDEISNINSYIDDLVKTDVLQIDELGNLSFTENGMNTFLEHKKFDSLDRGIYEQLQANELNHDGLITNETLNEIVIINTEKEFVFGKYDAFFIGKYFEDGGLAISEEDKSKRIPITDENIKNKIFSLTHNENENEKNYKIIKSRLFKLLENGYLTYNEETKEYKLTDQFISSKEEIRQRGIEITSYDVNFKNNVLQGAFSISKEELHNKLSEIYADKEYINNQVKYNIGRFERFCNKGYMSKDENNRYYYTAEGIKNLSKLEYPNNEIINEKLKYFEKLGLIERGEDDAYKITGKFEFAMNNKKLHKSYRTIFDLIDKNKGEIDKDIIKESITKEITKMQNRLSKSKSDYKSIRNQLGVKCIKQQTIRNISKVMMDARCSYDEIKETVLKASEQFNLSHDEKERIIHDINKIYNKGLDNSKEYETKNPFTRRNWKELFRTIGKNEPEYGYKSSYSKSKYHSRSSLGRGIESIGKTLKSKFKKERLEDERKKEMDTIKDKLKKQQKDRQLNEARKQGKINKETEYGLKNLGSVKVKEETKEIER
jgi:hypothetical protein